MKTLMLHWCEERKDEEMYDLEALKLTFKSSPNSVQVLK